MRTRKLLIILLFFVGILMTAAAVGTGGGTAFPAGADGEAGDGTVQVLSRREYGVRTQQGEERPFSASDVLWRGGAAACDEAAATVYIPCDLQTLTPENGSALSVREILAGLAPAKADSAVFLCDDGMADDPAKAMAAGHLFEAVLISGRKREFFHIVLTGLPAVCLDKTSSEKIVFKEEHEGRIRFVPLSFSGREQEIRCRFHVRGNISSTLDKRPYKVSLLNGASDRYGESLGGLREDDDWILNPLYTDSSRIREMTAYALWEQVSAFSEMPQSSSRMRYVELFLDNSYQGIYGLMEPVDGRQLGLTAGDILYKIDRWDREYPYLDEYEEKTGETEILNDKGFPCVEIRFPKKWDRTASWFPMQLYHTFTFRSRNPQMLSDAGLDPDMDSVVSLSLYCALTHAMDNTWKNSFLIAKRGDGGSYRLYRTIWDLNYVFGDVFVYAPDDGYTAFDAETASAYMPLEDSTYDFEAFLAGDPSLYDSLCSKWNDWRNGGVSAETVCAAARENMELLTMSGAIAREMERWPQEKTCAEALEEMEEWIRDRFTYLDGHFERNT